MILFHILTLILVVLKLAAVPAIAALSWWLVFAPSLFVFAFGLIVTGCVAVGSMLVLRQLKKR